MLPEIIRVEASQPSLLATRLSNQFSDEPLVALNKHPSLQHTYTLLIHFYAPDGITPALDTDFGHVVMQSTPAGSLYLRQIKIDITHLEPLAHAFSLWEVRAIYTVAADSSEGVLVQYVIGDPVTSRGTVTSVATT